MELNTKYEITVDSNEISVCGRLEIREFVKDEGLPLLPFSFSMEKWILQTGEFRGKLPNRIGALLKKRHGIKLTPEQRTTIGNIARKHTPSDTKYTFDFVGEFDWEDGDFGDRGSCYWGDNTLARSVLEEEGALAIRFYKKADNGRAWLYQLDPETWVLFNAYGLETKPAARVFAEYLTQDTDEQWDFEGLDWLTVAKDTVGLVHINSCPQIIFVEGSGPPSVVDLEWPEYVECGGCEAWTLYVDIYNIGDERLCHTCAQHYTECNRCGEMFFRGGMYPLEEKMYCPDCYVEREAEIEEELRLERLEMRQHAARIIQEAEDLISSLAYDEQLAAGQLQFDFMTTVSLEETLSEEDMIGNCGPYHPGIRSPGAEAPA